jgi:hypothetical protein
MMNTPQEDLKQQILALVKKRGRPVHTEYIIDHLVLPEDILLNDLLGELVVEKRLRRFYTLLADGKPDCTYALIL